MNVKEERLHQLIAKVKSGEKAFLESASAIFEISEKKLYEPHGTLAKFCAAEFDFSNNDTARYRDAGEVLANLSGFDVLPTNESQCRELAKLESTILRIETWQRVLNTRKKITAALIRSFATTIQPRSANSTDVIKLHQSPIIVRSCEHEDEADEDEANEDEADEDDICEGYVNVTLDEITVDTPSIEDMSDSLQQTGSDKVDNKCDSLVEDKMARILQGLAVSAFNDLEFIAGANLELCCQEAVADLYAKMKEIRELAERLLDRLEASEARSSALTLPLGHVASKSLV